MNYKDSHLVRKQIRRKSPWKDSLHCNKL